MRGTARGTVRGTARSTARGAARGAARGTARGAAEGPARSSATSLVRGETEEAETDDLPKGGPVESIKSVYVNFKDTLYLLPDRIEPIAPQGIGYSHGAQPNLYFYLDKPSSKPMGFILLRKDALDPDIISCLPVDPVSRVIMQEFIECRSMNLGSCWRKV